MISFLFLFGCEEKLPNQLIVCFTSLMIHFFKMVISLNLHPPPPFPPPQTCPECIFFFLSIVSVFVSFELLVTFLRHIWRLPSEYEYVCTTHKVHRLRVGKYNWLKLIEVSRRSATANDAVDNCCHEMKRKLSLKQILNFLNNLNNVVESSFDTKDLLTSFILNYITRWRKDLLQYEIQHDLTKNSRNVLNW